MLEYYLIFCLATSITALLRIYIPLLNLAIKVGVTNSLTLQPILSCMVMIIMLSILAPFVFYTLISPKAFESAKFGTYQVVFKEDE